MAVAVLVRNLRIDAIPTQFKVACASNIGDMCIHSKMTVLCKTQIIHRLFEGNLSIAESD